MSMLRSANDLPDHGCGGLGRVAQGALSALSGAPDSLGLFLGYNTMPDPPFPMVGYLPFDLGSQAAAVHPASLLTMAADSMRAQPVPPKGSFDEPTQRMASTMRVDAMVLVCPAKSMAPGRAAVALLHNLAEGYYREGDAEACVDVRDAVTVLGVDRAGGRVMLVAERDARGRFGPPARVEEALPGELFGLLGEALDAQYQWTKAAFSL
ncbi:hypothetical protein ACTMTF_21285 [Nonomuraea sp. ZG12]|uniref:hypothetical protein n=1 Tax=Nonomuraea sp. ZG12 TaxID=3452207 RepID=UPI003F8CB7A0